VAGQKAAEIKAAPRLVKKAPCATAARSSHLQQASRRRQS